MQYRQKVLIAEDHAEWRNIVSEILQQEFEVIGFVERGDELVATASRLHPDVVTVDVSMPGRSGLNALPELRAALPDAIIVMVSATASRLYQEESLSRGADAYVSKSRVLGELLPAISAGRRRSNRDRTRLA